MPQDNQWNYEDGVVRSGSICRGTRCFEKPDLAENREPQVHLTHVLVRMPALLLARESDNSDTSG